MRQISETELVIEKSRFIGRCFPVSDANEAAVQLERIRKRHWDASHNCYAFRIGQDGASARSSDDGEPSGTAGAPILNVISRLELTDTLCVVTRYFGGILLGAGGLVRAYSNAATACIEAAGIVRMRPASGYVATLTYPQWAAAESALKKIADVSDVCYTDAVTVTFWLFDEQEEQTLARIRDLTDGRAAPKRTMREMRPDD